jgi:hypothetical protein
VASKTYCFLKVLAPQQVWDVIKVRMKGVRDSDKWMNPTTNIIKPIANDYIALAEFFEHLMQTGEATVYTWSFRNMIRDGRLERSYVSRN